MADLDIEGYIRFIWTYGGFHIEAYSYSLMCWVLAMLTFLSLTWAVNITCKSGLYDPGTSLFYPDKGILNIRHSEMFLKGKHQLAP